MSVRCVPVYRVGSMTPAVNAGAAADITATCDALAPAGHQRRLGALFASPTLNGAPRWVRGNDLVGSDVTVHEVWVPAQTTWAYPIRAWEDISWRRADPGSYWAAGVPVGEWTPEDHLDETEWEVLIDPTTIRSHRTVSTARVLAATDPSWREQTRAAIRRATRRARCAA